MDTSRGTGRLPSGQELILRSFFSSIQVADPGGIQSNILVEAWRGVQVQMDNMVVQIDTLYAENRQLRNQIMAMESARGEQRQKLHQDIQTALGHIRALEREWR